MIVLEILKWIGLVLLFLLLLLLCVLILVLFLPIKYRGEATYNKEEQFVVFKARWFWGLLRVKATFPQKPYFSVKVLWIDLLEKKKTGEVNVEAVEEPEEKTSSIADEPLTKPGVSEKSVEEPLDGTEAGADHEPDVEKKAPILDKLVGIKEKIQYYINIFQEQETKDLLLKCKTRILKILKSIRPRKIRMKGTVGFASPDTTGYLYGGYCMISSFLGKNVILTPDFEREVIDVSGSVKGRITVFTLVWNALRIYFDKRLMRVIRKLKKGGR